MAVTINGTTGILAPDIGIDGTTLTVDAVNDRVGISTSSPNAKLQIVTDSGARALTVTAPTLGPYITFETNTTPFADIGSEAGLVGSGSNTDMLTLNARGSRSLSFRTNSTERLRITGDGEVRVNNAAGASVGLNLYQISGAAAQVRFQGSATGTGEGDGFGLGNSGAVDAYVWNYEAGHIQFATSNSPRLTIDSAGNVGIGRTNPSYEFHVKGAGTVAYFEGTGGNSFIGLEDSDDSTVGFIGVDGGSLKFQTSGSSYSDKLVITPAGKVGIGTAVPNEELHIHASGTSYIRFTDEASGTGATDGAVFGLDNPHLYAWNYEAGDFVVATNATERLRITAAGLLDVSGGIHVTENVTPTSGRGVEIFEASAGVGQVQSFDRDGGSFDELRIKSNHLEVFTGSSNRLSARFNNSGSTSLFVNDATKQTHLFTTGAANAGLIYLYNASQDTTIALRTDGDSYLNGGDVGIGTNNPTRTLSVSGSINIQSGERIESYSSGGNLIIQGGSTYPGGHIKMWGGTGDDMITFNTSGASASSTERLRITSAGQVMIGHDELISHPNMDDLQIGDANGNRGLTICSGTGAFGSVCFGDSADGSGTDRYEGYIEYYHNDNSMRLGTSHTEGLRINSAGNVSIGAKSDPNWSSTVDALTIGYAGVLYEDSYSVAGVAGRDNYVILGNNTFYNASSGGNAYIRNDEAQRLMMVAGNFYFQSAALGTAGNAITFVDRFRISSGGYVNIGGNFSQSTYTAQVTRIGGNTDVMQIKGNSSNSFIRFTDSDATSDYSLGADDAQNNGFILYDRNASAYRLVVTNAGRVGINDSTSGWAEELQVTSNTQHNQYGIAIKIQNNSGYLMRFAVGNAAPCGSISGGSGNSTFFNTSWSDSRRKKNFETWNEEVLPYFKSLEPKKFNFTQEDDGTVKTKGYVAQDNVDKFPGAYPLLDDSEVDEKRYMFNPSGMVIYLMKALQEEIAKREALESRIAALEN